MLVSGYSVSGRLWNKLVILGAFGRNSTGVDREAHATLLESLLQSKNKLIENTLHIWALFWNSEIFVR